MCIAGALITTQLNVRLSLALFTLFDQSTDSEVCLDPKTEEGPQKWEKIAEAVAAYKELTNLG